MANPFGPWATLIDAGPNPQLSAFWKRRLTMLLPASQTSPALSRRNLLWLGVTGILLIVLPTFHLTPAGAEENKPAKKGKTIIVDTDDETVVVTIKKKEAAAVEPEKKPAETGARVHA